MYSCVLVYLVCLLTKMATYYSISIYIYVNRSVCDARREPINRQQQR